MKKAAVARVAALSAYALLAVTVVLWVMQIEDPNSRLVPFLIGTLPLLLLLRGMLHGRIRTHQIAVFVSLLYLIHGSTELFIDPALLPAFEVLITLTLMIAASFYAKWKLLDE